MTKPWRDRCAKRPPAVLVRARERRGAAVSVIRRGATFLGQGLRKTCPHRAGKSRSFVPPTLLQLFLVKDKLSNFERGRSFPPYVFG